jgi:hypothetical protein
MLLPGNIVGNGAVNSIVSSADNADIDAAGRLRVSDLINIFDNKQIFNNAPLFFDDQEESGSGTTSVYTNILASTIIGVAASTAGKRTRQTFMRFNYQPGNSQEVLMTGVLRLTGGGAGITTYIGPHDDGNGMFFLDDEGVPTVCLRSSTSGSPVDIKVPQSQWNIDKMDGTGLSGFTLDPAKMQIFVFDFLWLGADRVRLGLKINGRIHYVHNFINANIINTTYMSTPNLPLRYQIINDGTGVASTLSHNCVAVNSEGGQARNGTPRYLSTEGVHLNADVANTLYAMIGLRLQATALSCSVDITGGSSINQTNDDFEWLLMFNPVIAGTFTYSNVSNSCLQSAMGVTANTVSGGVAIAGGMSKQDFVASAGAIPTPRRLGATIDGTPDELILCVRPLTANADMQGSLTWQELT